MSQDTPQVQSEDCGDLEIDFNYEILPDDFLQYDLSFKLIVIGDSGVGKSCLTNRATTNLFEDTYSATVGFEFVSFNVKINEKVIKLQIWDTCGQELYRSLITNFYRNSSLAIIVYAINSKDSFENIEMWLRELRTHSNPDAKVFLIGNKIDLENERKITREQGENFAQPDRQTGSCGDGGPGRSPQSGSVRLREVRLSGREAPESRWRKTGRPRGTRTSPRGFV